MATEFPVEYLTALDKVIELSSFTTKYQVKGAEFVSAKTVMVPEIVFDGGTVDYDRFETEGTVELKYSPYELEKDRQKAFYIDAVEDINDGHVRTTNAVSEFQRRYLVPELDTYFFANVASKAKTKATETLTADNIKAEIRNAETQMVNNGFAAADLYMTTDALHALEDSINRQFAGEGVITDEVGKYNMFTIHRVPDKRLAGLDFAVIAPGTVRTVIKRAANYLFQPGEHTNGDGWLCQMRWVYGNIVRKNQAVGLYVNKAASTPGA